MAWPEMQPRLGTIALTVNAIRTLWQAALARHGRSLKHKGNSHISIGYVSVRLNTYHLNSASKRLNARDHGRSGGSNVLQLETEQRHLRAQVIEKEASKAFTYEE
jgi:hypothetical protein